MSPNSAATLRIPRLRAWHLKGDAAGTEPEEKGDVVGTKQEENVHAHGRIGCDERIPDVMSPMDYCVDVRSGVRSGVRSKAAVTITSDSIPPTSSSGSGMGIQAPDRRLGSFWHCLKFFLALLIMSGFFCGALTCRAAIGSAAALSQHQKNSPAYRDLMAQTFSSTMPDSEIHSDGPSLPSTHRSLAYCNGNNGPGPPTNASAGPSFTPNADADVIMHTAGQDPSDFGNEEPPEISLAPSPEPSQAPPSPKPLQTPLAPNSPVTETGPRKRIIHLPKRFRDLLPEALPSDEVEDPQQTSSERTVHTRSCRNSSILWNLPSPGPRKEIFPLQPTLPNLS
ncbi:hypothetical protein DFH07DRAFT_780717 [Mycena maculata]|uniref:Transmembrane protein n=1 Tax=Mycena maculata TaxID=230809 RepID=A0AAD7I356_9AGAR|nr:hypothetical protein DFH07DRAFT_780717 [Mycena maculata]